MRFDIDSFKEIADALTRNKRRSILTGFGIFWGLFMLLFLVGGGQGLKVLLMKNFEGFATNSMIIVAQPTSKPYKGFEEGRYWNLTYNDVDRLKTLFPELSIVTPQITMWGKSVSYNGRSINGHVKGVEDIYRHIEEPVLKYGRFLSKADIQQKRNVCVIGKQIYQQLFPEGGNPCGQFIDMGGIYYQIVGVDFSSSNISLSGSKSESVIVPITVLRDVLNYGNVVELICVLAHDGIKLSGLEPRIRQAFAHEHFFDCQDESALMLLDAARIFGIIDTLFRGLNILIWIIGVGTLLAGAIGVSNIMLVVVRERTIEIGIRRAIGATPNDILSQIIIEGLALTMMAGMLSVIFSVSILQLIETVSHSQSFQITIGTAISSLVLLTIVGLLASIAPAYRAMHIKPVDAMRDE